MYLDVIGARRSQILDLTVESGDRGEMNGIDYTITLDIATH